MMPTQRLFAAGFQPRFQAWNSELSKLPQGRGWKKPPKASQQNNTWPIDKRRVRNADHELVPSVLKSSYHEIGHFLAAIATGLTLSSAEVHPNGHGCVNYRRKLDLDGIMNSILFSYGGKAMMEMIYGKDPLLGCTSDYDNAYFDKQYALSQWPDQAALINNLYNNPVPIVRAHLMQYDWKTVNALAHHLNRDRFWDKKKVNAMIKEFKLDQVPSAQKPRP